MGVIVSHITPGGNKKSGWKKLKGVHEIHLDLCPYWSKETLVIGLSEEDFSRSPSVYIPPEGGCQWKVCEW